MKKILALAVGMLLIPFTAFGMEAMDDTSMDSITGQSGVAIALDNVGIYSSGEYTWYQGTTGDTDSGAWFGILAGDEITRVDLNLQPTGEAVAAGFDSAGDELSGYGDPSALMIQTVTGGDTAPLASTNMETLVGTLDMSGVLITLGTLKIQTFTATATEFGIGESTGTGDVPDGWKKVDVDSTEADATYGRVASDGGTTQVLGGQILIMPVNEYIKD